MPLSVFARIRPKPHYLEDARRAIEGILGATREEPGCLTFTLHADRDGGDHLYLFEIWESEKDLEAHYEKPYTKRVFEAYAEWLEEPVDIVKMTPLG